MRRLFERIPSLLDLAESKRIAQLVHPLIGTRARPVRALFFDKNGHANWKVPWHQDLTIAVTSKREIPDYGPWSVKDGEVHVQPPMSVMERMASVRLHLDDCGDNNGPLRVVPGSHRLGRIRPEKIRELVNELGETVCTADSGDAIVMSPLLLHASAPAREPSHRRVLHFEYCSCELPPGLDWAEGRPIAPARLRASSPSP